MQPGPQSGVLAVVRVGSHPREQQPTGHRALQHGDAQLRLGGEGNLVGDSGRPAPLTIAAPGLRQVQTPVVEGVATRGGMGEHHHDLAVADVTGRPAVLVADPDGLITWVSSSTSVTLGSPNSRAA